MSSKTVAVVKRVNAIADAALAATLPFFQCGAFLQEKSFGQPSELRADSFGRTMVTHIAGVSSSNVDVWAVVELHFSSCSPEDAGLEHLRGEIVDMLSVDPGHLHSILRTRLVYERQQGRFLLHYCDALGPNVPEQLSRQ